MLLHQQQLFSFPGALCALRFILIPPCIFSRVCGVLRLHCSFVLHAIPFACFERLLVFSLVCFILCLFSSCLLCFKSLFSVRFYFFAEFGEFTILYGVSRRQVWTAILWYIFACAFGFLPFLFPGSLPSLLCCFGCLLCSCLVSFYSALDFQVWVISWDSSSSGEWSFGLLLLTVCEVV